VSVTSSPSNLSGVDGASFCTSHVPNENVTRGVNVAIMNSAALVTRPFSYFETLQPFRAAAAFAFGPARYIAHADKPEGIGDLRCFLVQEVLSAVRDAFFYFQHRDAPLRQSEGRLCLAGINAQ
jgi:hypothetical protein